jgi:hypothetical protein
MFLPGFEFKGGLLLREIVPHDAQPTLFYTLYDMSIPTPKIEEVIEFQKLPTDKENLEIF